MSESKGLKVYDEKADEWDELIDKLEHACSLVDCCGVKCHECPVQTAERAFRLVSRKRVCPTCGRPCEDT